MATRPAHAGRCSPCNRTSSRRTSPASPPGRVSRDGIDTGTTPDRTARTPDAAGRVRLAASLVVTLGALFVSQPNAFLALSRDNVWIELSGLPPKRLPEYYARGVGGRLAR